MNEPYIYFIVALLPLSGILVVIQVNPYHALVIRGILGAIAAMVYAVLGAADVALTEALVGTMLSITLYVVAVRSSLIMRLGVLEGSKTNKNVDFQRILANLRQILVKRHMRLELVPYEDDVALQKALLAKEIHATCLETNQVYLTSIRVQRLYDIIAGDRDWSSTNLSLDYCKTTEQKHP